jgi:hypothetical protein
MVTNPIDISAFQQSYSLSTTFSSYQNRLNMNDEFLEDITAAYAENESPLDQDLFDPAFDVSNPAIGLLKNAANGGFSEGVPIDVSDGSVTLSQKGAEASLLIQPYHNVSVQKVSDDALKIMNETTGEGLQLETGQNLTVSGSGEAEIVSGDGKTLRLESGEAATLVEKNDSLKVKESTFRKEINFRDGARTFDVIGENGSNITLYTGPSESMTFSAVETGELQRTEDGAVRISNPQTGESITINTTDTLKAEGKAELTVGEDGAFQIQDGDKISVSSQEGTVRFRNTSIAGSVSLGQTPSMPSDNPIEAAASPITSQIRNYVGLLQQSASTIGLSRVDQPTRENGYGSIDNVITPISERSVGKLLQDGLSIDPEDQSVFFADQSVSELSEELPSILDSSGSDDKFSIEKENQEAFAAFENEESEFGIGGDEDDFAIGDESQSEFAILDEETESEFLDETV